MHTEKDELEKIIEAISVLRTGKIIDEYKLQNDVAIALMAAGIGYKKEWILGKGNRIDFLTHSGVGIEIKKGKPNRSKLEYQINRYAEFEAVKAVIIVVETSLKNPMTSSYNGKPCTVMGLQKLWGIAL